jgi:hypothetical protein
MQRRSIKTINKPYTFFGVTPMRIFILSMFSSLYLCFFVWGLGVWGFLVFIPLGYAITFAVNLFFEYLLFPLLNTVFKKSYGPTTIVRDIVNASNHEASNEEVLLTEEQKRSIKRFCSGNWDEALAGGAYELLVKNHPEILDAHEEKRNSTLMNQLIKDLSGSAPRKKWGKAIELLASRVASSYVEERLTGENVGPGGQRTLMGHTHQSFIPAGLIGTIASSLDNGATEKAYHNYIAVDDVFKEVARGQSTLHDPKKLIELWQLAQENLDTSFTELESKIASLPT